MSAYAMKPRNDDRRAGRVLKGRGEGCLVEKCVVQQRHQCENAGMCMTRAEEIDLNRSQNISPTDEAD
jgi:hypothetical protein